jgi:HEAT repeat protein
LIRLASLLSIKQGEGRMAALVISVMLLTSAGFTLGSTGVEALFFARFGVEYLPYMYMGLGTLSFLTSLGITALLGRVRREKLYIFVPIAIAVLTVIAWAALFSGLNAVYPVLWLGKEVVNSLISLVTWGIAGVVCDTRQSKRLFPLFNAGRILGAVLGGLGTGAFVSFIGAQNLLLAWAVMLMLAFVFSRALLRDRMVSDSQPRRTRRRRQQPALVQEMQKGYQFVRGSAFMRWISIAAILFSILYFSIALPFSKSATAQYPDENALAGFLGLFNGLSTAAAFLASVFLANRLYARFGIMNAILALPVIYLVGFGGLALSGAFLVVVAFRFVQMLWLSGIADSAYQAMFNAVPAERRDQVRAFIGGVPEQAGTFIAGAILLVGEQAFSSQQLAFVGLMAAIATTFVIWRAGRAYNQALVASLRAGHPTLFTQDNRLGLQQDATAIHVALDGLANPDPLVRCVSAEILGSYRSSAAINALVKALQDENADVCLAALKGLARPDASPALLEIAALLNDPQPALRAQAVDTLRVLTPYPRGLNALLQPMLNDPDSVVRVRAAVALLTHDPQHPARSMLRQLSMIGDVDERILALNALAEVGDPDALTIFAAELDDMAAPPTVRCAAAAAIATCGAQAIPALKSALAAEDLSLRQGAASALGHIGETALPVVLDALAEPASEQGALLALEQLPAWKESARVREYAKGRIAASIRYESYRLSIHNMNDERVRLLAESLQTRARSDGINALKALSLLNDRETLVVAIDNLQSKAAGQRANALESLEAIRDIALVRPLLCVWEPLETDKPAFRAQDVFVALRTDDDAWLRTCAAFASVSFPTDTPMDTLTTLSIMERVLLLRRVSLLADLTPADLQRVAAIVTEQHFADKDVICEQGEPGEEMYLIVSGEVRVLVSMDGRPEKEIARREAGEVVGEMSIISGEPRTATVTAVGDVRMLRLDRMSFESLLRERPEVSLAVMRVLCQRLKQLTQER